MIKKEIMLIFICAVVLFTINLPDEFVGFQTRFGLFQPIYYSREHTTTFVTQIETLRKTNPGPLVFYKINPDNEDIKYAANAQTLITPNYAKNPEEILSYKESAYFITPQKYYNRLPDQFAAKTKQITKGNIGHKKCIAFKLTKVPPGR